MKNKIIDHSITLFAKKGYYGTTLGDIANQVNLKKASLYHHFKSKDQIFTESAHKCINYLHDFIVNNMRQNTYSNSALYQFLFKFIFDVDDRYIRMYVQLAFIPQQFSDEIYNKIKSIHKIIDEEIIKFYQQNYYSIDFEEFHNMIMMFLESWYLRCTFIERFGDLEESKNKFKDEVYSIINQVINE
ncbi:TetR family transcriptional regulator [Staphylococcus kloosii]|uniref:Biofilm operon icaADBC HTH-type negative transcriptional regulator IcaR n=2 Tax=Staphylococcus kloosii TaxID=29384 RepID=A0A151A428_9STAP|nr:TetR family transcriptional regulator [Staphylococcus kloosii]AVQ34672.1 TetR/AcrR family transcriptional regulator [Staphylococcus kloosii]KYH14102.1 transcriptional regulator [Staphylococcus kloosii]KYH15675.1 transcriptional regulator [Staphylococcus kloosii]MBF7023029.1 TetR family transcriptional regulator [Staphylococcus kloosii]MBF7029808.1 TetR family transcriptional regulator [Staphylococcus kloosii]